MRWFWIDRFTEFVCTQRATAIKTVSLSEEHVHDYVPGFPMMSVSFVVEGLAQTGGLLVGQASDWRNKVVLAKAPKAVFHDHPRPGDCLRGGWDAYMRPIAVTLWWKHEPSSLMLESMIAWW